MTRSREDETNGWAPAPRIRRRALLGAAAGTGLLGLAGLAGCAPARSADAPQTAEPETADLETTDPATADPETTETTPTMAADAPRILLAYFSRPGENYHYGDRRTLDVGNTEVLAGLIADRVVCDVCRIEAADPYPEEYDPTVARNSREQDEDARPTIAGALPDIAGYDTVILASPIWNVRPPMIMTTFVDAVDLGGRTVLPVTTHAMSGLGRSRDVYAAAAPDATIGESLAVQGETVADAGPDVDRWIAAAGLATR